MSGIARLRSLLLASVLAVAGAGAALAQMPPSSPPSPQAQPAQQNGQSAAGQPQNAGPSAMPAQYNNQNPTQAQPIGNANAAEGQQGLPVDQVVDVQGTQVACSGIGKGDETNPQFAGLPVKFSLVGGYGQWLGNETLTVSGRNGGQDISVKCSGPWVLMRLDPGRYTVTADVPDAGTKTVSFSVPSSGSREVTIRFPQAMQGESSYHATESPAATTL